MINKRKLILILSVLLSAIPVLAVIKSNSLEGFRVVEARKCSLEIENLMLCADSSKIVVSAGEPVSLKLSWTNSSDTERNLSSIHYSISVINDKGEKLLPIQQQKQLESQRQIKNNKTSLEEEPTEELIVTVFSSTYNPSIFVEAREEMVSDLKLTGEDGYDLTAKGIYRISISKTVPSLKEGKSVEFVLDGIEIEVK